MAVISLACEERAVPADAVTGADTGVAEAGREPTSAPTETHTGNYVFGHEVRTFQACGSDRVLWVSGSPAVLAELRSSSETLTSEPYEPIEVVLRGRLVGRRATGFASDYDGELQVEELLSARAADGGCEGRDPN